MRACEAHEMKQEMMSACRTKKQTAHGDAEAKRFSREEVPGKSAKLPAGPMEVVKAATPSGCWLWLATR
jgi:hypothetical protein